VNSEKFATAFKIFNRRTASTLQLRQVAASSFLSIKIIKKLIYTITYMLMPSKQTTMRIEEILDNASEEFLDRFFETILNEINSDEEPYYKKARQLLLAYLNNEHADDFFIAICGWSLESLIERSQSDDF
jgi:hypothetical protein